MSAPVEPAPFLPRTRAELEARGWDGLDILLVTGDGYVDHAVRPGKGKPKPKSKSKVGSRAPAGIEADLDPCG